jgi:hypothetical protein
MSQNAVALRPDVDTVNLQVRLSGASATENAITNLAINDLCLSSIDVFDGLNQKAVFCVMDSSTVTGLSGTLNVYIRKTSLGGSGTGAGPVCTSATNANTLFMIPDTVQVGADKDTATCWDDGLLPAARGALAVPSVATLGPEDFTAGDGKWACLGSAAGGATESLFPQGGITDVKPTEVFGSASPECGANVFPSFELVMGAPVSLALYVALQEAQGIVPGVAGCAAGDAEDECMPSLSKQTLAGLASGAIKKWTDVLIDGLPLYGNTAVTPTVDEVTYCRRSNSSGTFATHEIRMLQRSCIAGAQVSVAPPGSQTAGPIVPTFNSGSDDVERCLDSYSNTGGFLVGAAIVPGSNWAFGHNSLDRNPVTAISTQDDWRFIKVDGVAPSFVNVANGTYAYTVTSTLNWADGTPAAAPTGDVLRILEELRDNAADPASLGGVRVDHVFGSSGVLALAEKGYTVQFDGAGAYDVTEPVTPWSHINSAGTLTNCLDGVRAATNPSVPLPQ